LLKQAPVVVKAGPPLFKAPAAELKNSKRLNTGGLFATDQDQYNGGQRRSN